MTASGTEARPITLVGAPGAVLTAGGYGIHIKADYWHLRGFTVANALKGVVLTGASHNVLDGLTIRDIDQEAIHLRAGSSHNIVTRSTVRNTGRATVASGRALSIGSTAGNWASVTGGEADRSDGNQIIGNVFGPDLRGGIIQAAEGASGGIIAQNQFDGTGMVGPPGDYAWVIIRGNGYQVLQNTGVSSPQDGFATARALQGWGCGTIFGGNRADVRGPGYGIRVDAAAGCPTIVMPDNVAINAGSGLTNVSGSGW